MTIEEAYKKYRHWAKEEKGYLTCVSFEEFKNIIPFVLDIGEDK